jgi:ABC-type phosphate/phosphonate transport system substrate-binding protein
VKGANAESSASYLLIRRYKNEKNSARRGFILSALVLAVLRRPALTRAEKANSNTHRFNPSENTDSVTVNGQAFSDYLSAKTGLKTRVYVASGYAAVVEALRTSKSNSMDTAVFANSGGELCKALPLLKSSAKARTFITAELSSERFAVPPND